MLDITQIKEQLPHRYPFLFVDKVIELKKGVSIKAIKSVTYNEYFFQGHFPVMPVMPGVLIVEALAQTSGLLYHASKEKEKRSSIQFLTSIDKFKFKHKVTPGDELTMESEVIRIRSILWKFSVRAFIKNKEVCSGILSSAEVPNDSQ